MEQLKGLLKHEKKIIEGFFISFIGGWILMSLFRGIPKQAENLEKNVSENFALIVIGILICSIAIGGLYVVKDIYARTLTFILVFVFSMECIIESKNIVWATVANNNIGAVCYQLVMCAVSVLAFLYVRDDIFSIVKKIKLNKMSTNIIIAVLGVVTFAFVGAIGVYRYLTFSNSTFDFGIFAQMFEYMKQKGTVETTVERNYLLSHFGVHFSPIFYLALPIYFIFPSATTVQLIQSLFVALPLIPIVLLCRNHKFSHWMTIAISLIYLLYPATIAGTFYDIHENAFLVFFVLMTIWAAEKKKNIAMAVCMIGTFMVKEDAAVYILILGAFLLFSRKDKARGGIMMGAALIYFVIAIAIVNSFGLGILETRFSNLYLEENGGLGQIIKTILLNPAYVLRQIITNSDAADMDKIEYIILMFAPVAGAVFAIGKKYSRYILLAPLLILNLCTTYLYLHHIGFQYNFGIVALTMYLIIINMSDIKLKKAKTIVGVTVICTFIMFLGNICPKYEQYSERYKEGKEIYQKIETVLDTIPRNASVCISGFYMPHISRNLEVYDQNHIESDIYTDYLVIDARYDDEKAKFDNILASGQYEQIASEPGLIEVYHKK